MIRNATLGSAVGAGIAVCLGSLSATAQTPTPGSRPNAPAAPAAAASAKPARPEPDYKVVFWFSRDDLKHQVYDVRKGQYTQAVDDWVNQQEFDASGYALPGRMATTRSVYLKNEPGTTEAEKLAAAIRREEARILGKGPATSPYLRPPRFSFRAPERRTGRYEVYRPVPLGPLFAPWESTPLFSAPEPLFPVPYPYPRPHP
jgi:hypothetical protein